MTTSIFRKTDRNPNSWSGGTTTELFIFPEGSRYQDRDFDFRLSTATVEIQSSIFTKFDGYRRKLLLLNGSMALDHDQHHLSKLSKFDVDTFDGSWQTTSFGKCEDFNLICREQLVSELFAVKVAASSTYVQALKRPWDWFFIYAHLGELTISLPNGNNQELHEGALFMIREPGLIEVRMQAATDCELVMGAVK